MATHGDRKLLKAASLTDPDDGIIQYLYDEYVKMVTEYPEAKG